MEDNIESTAPLVFISYSHDSPEHKKWVSELARYLMDNGVKVILDQWELGLGDDVPKFMEKSVKIADRVLMICSETYVTKANEGSGGVGYEAMIVTGEIIRDLGTSKFIPVVRQGNGEIVLPDSVSTRFYVDFSERQDFIQSLETLLRELHKAPALPKPSLGKNPFALTPSGEEIPEAKVKPVSIPKITPYKGDIKQIYLTALEIVRQGDAIAWRKIIQEAKSDIAKSLIQWRKKYNNGLPSVKNERFDSLIEGIAIYAPLMSIALAGVESGRERYSNQIAFLEDILYPKGWNRGGMTTVVEFPKTVAFVYQALYGAVCLQTDQLNLAINLATALISLPGEQSSTNLYRVQDIIGWPDSLGGDCSVAYDFLSNLPEKLKWMNEIYGDHDGYREAIHAYYFVLSVIEFIGLLIRNEEEALTNLHLSLAVPLTFARDNEDIARRAYRLVKTGARDIIQYWRGNKIEDNQVVKLWPFWIKIHRYWLSRAGTHRSRSLPIYENLINDIL